MLSVVCWKWGDRYSADFPNRLRSMLARHLHIDHQLYCITDDPDGLDEHISAIPMWPCAGLGRARRLRLFSEESCSIFGERVLQLDIDCVIVNDITPLVSRPEPFLMWMCLPAKKFSARMNLLVDNPEDGIGAYNASMMLLDMASAPPIWRDYTADPDALEREARRAGLWGLVYHINKRTRKTYAERILARDDDQAIVSLYAKRLGVPTWRESDGVYKWGRRGFENKERLPENARIVFTNGSLTANHLGRLKEVPAWIEQHWC